MKTKISVLILFIIGCFYNASAIAAPININCPISTARVAMTTNLPNGWWRTPYVNRLQGTTINVVGGKRTLVCKYGNHAAFWTMRLEPAGKNCQRRPRGFHCRDIIQPPRTHRTGPLVIPQTYLADLDTGQVKPQGADIWFEAKTATRRFITPRNGARIAIAGRRSIGLAGCKQRPLRNTPIPIRSIPVGTYVCVKTNQGRYSQFRVNRAAGPSPGNIHLGYTTWKK